MQFIRTLLPTFIASFLVANFAYAQQAEDPWLDEGNPGFLWFNEPAVQDIGGTWHSELLQAGTQYTMTFNVQEISGQVKLFLGDNDPQVIDSVGPYSIPFTANDSSSRHMAFKAVTNDESGKVFFYANNIRVSVADGGDPWRDAGYPGWIWDDTDANHDIAGAWWFDTLKPGTNYTMSFNLNEARGTIALYLGDRDRIVLSGSGPRTFDFWVNERRRMMFRTEGRDQNGDARLSVDQIHVNEQVGTKQPRKGHYISFGKEINLKQEMMNILDNPDQHTDYEISEARKMRDALTAPGVVGFWVPFQWKTVETGPDDFDWALFEDTLEVAERLNKRVVMKFSDRSFDNTNPVPLHLQDNYSIRVNSSRGAHLNGYVSKRWTDQIINRTVRFYTTVAQRYDAHPNFEGLATGETALGQFVEPQNDYSAAKYRDALISIINTSKPAFQQSKLFFYLNFLKGGQRYDLSQDMRVDVIDAVAGGAVALGRPDITPDEPGQIKSATQVYMKANADHPSADILCHAQFDDHRHQKSNQHRDDYVADTQSELGDVLRRRQTGVEYFNRAILADSRHPPEHIGDYWTPYEILGYARENFGCDYFFWHYNRWLGEFRTLEHVLPVIADNPDLAVPAN